MVLCRGLINADQADELALRPWSQRQIASEFWTLQIVPYDSELDWQSTRFMPYPHLLFWSAVLAWPAHLGRYRAHKRCNKTQLDDGGDHRQAALTHCHIR
jgi:hypothetical protein